MAKNIGLLKTMIKPFLPMVLSSVEGLDDYLIKLLKEQKLEPGEDEIVITLTAETNVMYINLVAVSVNVPVRLVQRYKLQEFIKTLLNQM